MHLVAVNGEFTETLDMVSILKSDDIQPLPPHYFPFPGAAGSHLLEGVSVNRHAESGVHNYEWS